MYHHEGFPYLWYTANGPNTWHYYGIPLETLATKQFNMSNHPQRGKWSRLELHYRHSTGGRSNGLVRWWWDGKVVAENTNILTRENDAHSIRGFIFPAMPDKQAGDFWVYIDDIYVDKTPSRIEICSGPSWNYKDKCEVQIPSSWTDTTISVTVVSQEAMPSSTNRYIYVVDSSGIANSQGFPITISASNSSIAGVPITSGGSDNVIQAVPVPPGKVWIVD